VRAREEDLRNILRYFRHKRYPMSQNNYHTSVTRHGIVSIPLAQSTAAAAAEVRA
jgi:hypothetical protein